MSGFPTLAALAAAYRKARVWCDRDNLIAVHNDATHEYDWWRWTGAHYAKTGSTRRHGGGYWVAVV